MGAKRPESLLFKIFIIKITPPPPPHYREVFRQGKVKNGFFIEAGADDFESDSNSVYFEEQETLIYK